MNAKLLDLDILLSALKLNYSNHIIPLMKFAAVSAKNEKLRLEFEDMFYPKEKVFVKDENGEDTEEFNLRAHRMRNKAYAIADQWYKLFNGTEQYDNYKELSDISEAINIIKSKPKVKKEKIVQVNNKRVLLELKYPDLDFSKFDNRFINWLHSNVENEELFNLENFSIIKDYSYNFSSYNSKFASNDTFKSLLKDIGVVDLKDFSNLNIETINKIKIAYSLKDDMLVNPLKHGSYKPSTLLAKIGKWNVWKPETMTDAIEIPGYYFDGNKFITNTVWCTSKIYGNNFFYRYSNNKKTLFMVIADNPSKPEDYIAIGTLQSGNINYGGSATVLGNNRGLRSEYALREMLGASFAEIIKIITNKDIQGISQDRDSLIKRVGNGDYLSLHYNMRYDDEFFSEALKHANRDGKILISKQGGIGDKSVEILRRSPNFEIFNNIFKKIKNPSKEELVKFKVYNEPRSVLGLDNPSEELLVLAVTRDRSLFELIDNKTDAIIFAGIKQDPNIIISIDNPTEEMSIYAVSRDSYLLKHIKDQTDDIVWAAITNKPSAIRFADNQTEEMSIYAVTNDGYLLEHIKDQTDDIVWAAIKQDPIAIVFADNQTEEMSIYAVTKDGYTLESIKDQTDAVVWVAIKKDPSAIKGANNPTEEMSIYAVTKDSYLLEYIKDQTDAVVWVAIKKDPSAIKGANNPTEEMSIYAVSRDSYLLKHIKDQTDAIVWAAIKNDPSAIKGANNPTEEMSIYAVSRDSYLLKHIKDQTDAIVWAAIKNDPSAIKDVNSPTEEMEVEALRLDKNAIRYIANPSERAYRYLIFERNMSVKLITKERDKLNEKTDIILLDKLKRERNKLRYERMLQEDRKPKTSFGLH